MMASNQTIYDRLIERFGVNGRISAVHQAELDAIRLDGDIDKNDTFWLSFLPIYLTQARLDFLKEADGFGGGNRFDGQDLDKLAQSIAARIEPDQIHAEIDSAILSRAISKLVAPDIQSAVEDAVAAVHRSSALPLDAGALRNIVKEASRDSLINRNLIISVCAGLLMAILSGWYSGFQSDKRWELIVNKQQEEIKQLSARSKND